MAVCPHLFDHVRGDIPQVAHQPEVALAEGARRGAGVAGLDRHGDHACASLACGRNQQLRFEHEALAGHVWQGEHRGRIQPLAALAVDQAEAAPPGNAPVAEIVADAADGGLGGALAHARTDDHAARVAVGGSQQAWEIGCLVLAIAVHGHHRAHAKPLCFGKATAQCRALAHALRVTDQRDRHAGDALGGAVVRTVVDHDDMRAIGQRVGDHFADAQRLVQGRHQDGGVLPAQRLPAHCRTSTRSTRPGAAYSATLPPLPAHRSSSGSIGAMALPAMWRASAGRGRAVVQMCLQLRLAGLAGRAQHQRATQQPLAGGDAPERPDRAGVVAGQQHGLRPGSVLHQRLQQALREATRAGAHRRGRGHRTGADGPVAGGGVVHRVVELGWRNRQRIAGQRGAHVVGDGQVAVGRGKDRRQAGRVAACGATGGQRSVQRHRHRVRRTPAFVGSQQLQRAAAREGAGSFPAGQALGPEADPFDGRGQHQRARPNSSEQLLPPKPKELFMA